MVSDETRVAVHRRILGGWQPSKTRELAWVRGARMRREGEDLIEDLTGAQIEPMTQEEEEILIRSRYSSDPTASGKLDPVVVESSGEISEVPDDVT